LQGGDEEAENAGAEEVDEDCEGHARLCGPILVHVNRRVFFGGEERTSVHGGKDFGGVSERDDAESWGGISFAQKECWGEADPWDTLR
jgi:hypothetical protein